MYKQMHFVQAFWKQPERGEDLTIFQKFADVKYVVVIENRMYEVLLFSQKL